MSDKTDADLEQLDQIIAACKRVIARAHEMADAERGLAKGGWEQLWTLPLWEGSENWDPPDDPTSPLGDEFLNAVEPTALSDLLERVRAQVAAAREG